LNFGRVGVFGDQPRVLVDLLEPVSKQCEVEKNHQVTWAG